MSNVKISELPAASTPSSTDILPIVQSGGTRQITFGGLLTTAFTQTGSTLSRTSLEKMREWISAPDFTGATTNAKIQAASDSFLGAKGVVIVPAGVAADSAAPTLPETTTVIDFRGDANPPSETTPSYTGVHVDFNSTSSGAISGMSVWQRRSSPSVTSSAFLATSFFTGTLPNAQTLSGITAQNSIFGAVTPGTGVVASVEAYTSIQSTGGTIADVRGLTATVNLDRAAETTNITTASAVFAGQNRNNGGGSGTIVNSYGLYASAQTIGTTRNYAIYNEGCLLQNHQQRWDGLDKDGNVIKVARFGTGPTNNNILLSGLTDALGWKWTDQAGTALYAHLTATGIGYGIDPAYGLHITKTTAGDKMAVIANPSATGYGLFIAAGDTSRYALGIGDNTGAAVNFSVLGSGVVAIGNTLNAVSPTSPDRTITMNVGGTTVYIHCKTTNN